MRLFRYRFYRFHRCRIFSCVALLISLASNSTPVIADLPAQPCADLQVEVISTSTADFDRVCAGAAKADAFFRSHGITMQKPIQIRLHESMINSHPAHIGLYDSKQHQIDLLSYPQTLEQCREKPPFGVSMCEPIYISFVTHEISHAIADQNFQYRPVPMIAQEYLAYVAQFATMETNARSQILQLYDVEPFDGLENMSIIYYELNPNAFGVKAFLHYQSLSSPGEFIRDLLSGDTKPKTQPNYWW